MTLGSDQRANTNTSISARGPTNNNHFSLRLNAMESSSPPSHGMVQEVMGSRMQTANHQDAYAAANGQNQHSG